jgi:hypothetical protein
MARHVIRPGYMCLSIVQHIGGSILATTHYPKFYVIIPIYIIFLMEFLLVLWNLLQLLPSTAAGLNHLSSSVNIFILYKSLQTCAIAITNCPFFAWKISYFRIFLSCTPP